ncbi:MAG: ComEC/Rec2 family competence protein [Candidatus Saccharimonadales bacterium]
MKSLSSLVRPLTTRRLHPSWSIATISLGVLVGTALVLVSPEGLFHNQQWLVIAISIVITGFIKPTFLMTPLFLLGGILVGLNLGSIQQQQLNGYQQFFDQNVVLEGLVADDTIYGPSGDIRLRINQITIDSHELPGDVWVSTRSDLDIKRGDIVKLQGYLNEGFGNLSASIFRARLVDIYRPHPGDIARKTRDWLATNIQAAIPEPESFLGISYLFGQRQILPSDLLDRLRILGLAHVVVASGFHLSIVVKYLRRSFARLSKYLSVFISFAGIAAFLMLTGFSTSMTRASLVSGLSLLAWYYGRSIHPVVLLLFVAAITVVLDPSVIWGDVGWFLSFTAFAGVIILAPLLNSYFWGESEPGMFRYILLATTSAQITTFPVVAYVFGHYSPLALASNLLILPLVPAVMALTLLSGVGAAAIPSLASIFGLPAYIILRYMNEITNWLADQPAAYNEIVFSAPMLILSYILILGLILYLLKVTGYSLRRENPVE